MLKNLVVVALFGLCMTAVACESKKVGDACETYRSSECGGKDGTCLGSNAGNYCTVSCAAAKDCPAGWKCEPIKKTTINGSGQTKAETTVQMCIKPA
jgi:hypothetical protein